MRGLDGLRGLAVAVVVVFHLGVGALRGGYLGVDVFFVLSGYLITSILLREHAAKGRIDLRRFWIRRARRLTPALLGLLFAIALYAARFASRDELPTLRGDALATLGYVANWRAIFAHRSYWELFAAPSLLEHTWSLAIEEQFYLLWPLCLWAGLRLLRLDRRRFFVLVLVSALASAACMAWQFDAEDTSRAYFGTDTRAAAILFGAAYAAWPWSARLSTRARDVLGGLALILIAASCVLLEGRDPWLYRGGFWLVEMATLALIACATSRAGWIERLLALRPLRVLGTVSYGVYLWHWPVFCVLTPERVALAPWLLIVLRLSVTTAIAAVSYVGLERPIRERGLPVRHPLVATTATLMALVATLLLVTRSSAPEEVVPPVAGPALPPALARVEVAMHDFPPQVPEGTMRVLVLGDSVAQALGIAMRAQQDDFGAVVAERGVGDCSIMEKRKDLRRGQELGHPDPSHGCAATWVRDVQELRPDVTLVVVGGAFMTPMTIDKKKVMACDPGWQEFYRARLHQLTTEMGDAAGRIVFATTPIPGERWRERHTLEWVECLNGALTAVAKQRTLSTIPLATWLCPERTCRLLEDDAPIRPDGLHPVGPGARGLSRWMWQQLRELRPSR